MRPARRAVLAAALVVPAALPAAVGAAGGSLPRPGRYTGQTGDGHVFQFTVEPSRKPGHPRKITHFYLVYDIAGCRSGPVRQRFFASVPSGPPASRRGTFSRDVNTSATARAGLAQLSLTGRFTSPTRASGSFRVGVAGKCPIDDTTTSLTFHARRAG